MANEESITYATSGVDIQAGERAVDLIREMARRTHGPRVLSGIGGFGALFSMGDMGMKEPVLVSSTDGVGTKLRLAFMTDRHDTVGIDAVAMCVNDVITSGAEPLFFLDYVAVGRLLPEKMAAIVSGIAKGCEIAGCSLVGGEMAEMPGFYADGEYDIAGFSVGAVDREEIIDGTKVAAGDIVLGIPSSGLHSNGYSLVRKAVFEKAGLKVTDCVEELGGAKLGEALLEPTRIYAKEIGALKKAVSIHALAHITGGGLEGNTVRVLPAGRSLDISWGSWERPAVFSFLAKVGGIAEEEMRRVFNLGVGMAVILSPGDVEGARVSLEGMGVAALEIGVVR